MSEQTKPLRLSELQGKRAQGIRCPKCGCADLRVYWTRPGEGTIRRVRKCRNCGQRVPTFETA